MLHVLLLILKIILWIILGLLGLLVLLLFLILFAPIRYRADVSYQGGKTMQAIVKVRYLIVSFGLQFDQTTGNMEQKIRIFGFELGKKKKNKPKKTEKLQTKQEPIKSEELQTQHESEQKQLESITSEVKQTDDAIQLQTESELREPQTEPELQELETEPEIELEQKEIPQDDIPESFDLESDAGDEIPEQEKKAKGRLKAFFEGIWKKLKQLWTFAENHTPDKIAEAIQAKLEPLKKKVQRLRKFWDLSCTVKTRNYLKKYIPSIFRHILPRQIKGYVHYGLAEPYKTGQVTGYLSLIPFVYQKNLTLQPDFHQKVLELQLDLKGKIRIGYLIRIVLNINLWRTIKIAKKIMNH